jgi:hypothetical protein
MLKWSGPLVVMNTKINTLFGIYNNSSSISLTLRQLMRFKVFFLMMFLVSFSASAQKLTYRGFPSLIWPSLYKVEYEKVIGSEFEKPIFNEKTKILEGKSLVLPGYLVPFNNGMKSQNFILSSLPLNACFFCGVGGPETVVQVFTNHPVEYTDRPVEIRGILRLNDSDPEKMIYILESSEIMGELEF